MSDTADIEELPYAIVGAGIGGLTVALELTEAGIPFRIFEATRQMGEAGVGINVLPHASQELSRFGIEEELVARGILTARAAFYNRYGQFIYEEPLGTFAGYGHPQVSLHRDDLRTVLREALEKRGVVIEMNHRCRGFDQDDAGVTLFFDGQSGTEREEVRFRAAIACDGIHSAIRKQLYPNEGLPVYSGVNMWRGVTRYQPVLGGATMVHTGWRPIGKFILYPIRDAVDAEGNQLINWLAEVETETYRETNWGQPGKLEDFIGVYADWHFPWLDVPAFMQTADLILEYPMVDRDPLERWTFGRVTLLGDAAHPMVPRGSNGAGQAIIDAKAIRDAIVRHRGDPLAALKDYEDERCKATGQVVLANRSAPPDKILQMVYDRSGDQPFDRIEDLFSSDELRAVTDHYKDVAGYNKDALLKLAEAEAKAQT